MATKAAQVSRMSEKTETSASSGLSPLLDPRKNAALSQAIFKWTIRGFYSFDVYVILISSFWSILEV